MGCNKEASIQKGTPVALPRNYHPYTGTPSSTLVPSGLGFGSLNDKPSQTEQGIFLSQVTWEPSIYGNPFPAKTAPRNPPSVPLTRTTTCGYHKTYPVKVQAFKGMQTFSLPSISNVPQTTILLIVRTSNLRRIPLFSDNPPPSHMLLWANLKANQVEHCSSDRQPSATRTSAR